MNEERFEDVVYGTGCIGCDCERCFDLFYVPSEQDDIDAERENKEIAQRAADHLAVDLWGRPLEPDEHDDTYLLLGLLISELMSIAQRTKSAQSVAQTIMAQFYPEEE